jgi:Spy/CpxP family protein refolding chaperone
VSATKTTIVAILVIAVTFIAGVAVGVFGAFMMHRRGGDRIPRFASHAMVNRLDRHLDLTDEQHEKIAAIIERHHERINSMWKEVRPQVEKELDQANAEIEKVLTPEQREKFQKVRMHVGPPHGKHGHRGDRRRRESTR